MFDGIPIQNLTAPTLLGITVLMLLLGLLIPRFVYKEKKEEAASWKAAYEAERAARVLSDKQTTELLELSRTTHDILVALLGVSEDESKSGGAHRVVPRTR